MISSISQAFSQAKKQNRPALLTYIVAGDNTKNNSLKILKSISKEHGNVHYYDPSDYIKSDINTFEDRYHLTNEGNMLLAKEFKSYIVNSSLLVDK